MSTARKITDLKSYLHYCPEGITYYEWHNYIYKLELGVVYFRMLGTWTWYKSCISPIELYVSVKKGAMKRIYENK